MIPNSKQLRRPTYSDAGKMSVDWASLATDLVELIGWRVLAGGDLPDYVRFRAVCSHWRASTVRPRGHGVLDPRFQPRRWMMLPEGHGLYPGHPHLGGFVRFFSLSTGAFVRAHLPLLDDHVVLDSIDGLLLLHRDHDTAIRLLNPFTGDVAELPPLASVLPQIEFTPRHNEESKRTGIMSVLASVAVTSTGTITVMLAFDLLHRVAYATIGDQRWTLFAWKNHRLLIPVAFQGKFFAMQIVRDEGVLYIYQINPPIQDAADELSNLPLPVKIAECPMAKFVHSINFVECCSELLLVAYNDASRSKLVIYRLADIVNGKFEPVTSIGNHTLFVGYRCLCVSSSPTSSKGSKNLLSMSPNSVICLHSLPDNYGSQDPYQFEQYDLGTGIWIPASDGNIFRRPPPSPHTLIHHIFTCCHRKYWNKGLMFCAQTEEPDWLVKQELRYGA